ncbi:MAG: hypothetical protein LQ347_005901, partial [Umbilicaria vellea]
MASTEEYALLCLENPLLDIQGQGQAPLRPDEAMLEHYGVKANDAILAEEKHMGLYEDLLQNRDAKLLAVGGAGGAEGGGVV